MATVDYYNIGTPYNLSYDTMRPQVDIPYTYNPGNLTVFGMDGRAQDVGLRVDDSAKGKEVIWTSEKISNAYTHPGKRGNFPTFDGVGQLEDTGVNPQSIKTQVLDLVTTDLCKDIVEDAIPIISDNVTQVVTQNVSKVVDSKIGNKLNKVSPFTKRNLPVFDGVGELQDSNLNVDDLNAHLKSVDDQFTNLTNTQAQICLDEITKYDAKFQAKYSTFENSLTNLQATTTQLDADLDALYAQTQSAIAKNTAQDTVIADLQNFQTTQTSEQAKQNATLTTITDILLPQKLDKVSSFATGNLPIFDTSGQLVDSTLNAQTLVNEIDSKLDLVSPYLPSNVPMFNTNGQLVDSGVNATLLSRKMTTYRQGDVLVADTKGDIADSGFSINDSIATTKNLWSAAKTVTELDIKPNKPTSFKSGNVAVFDAAGNLLDGGAFPTDKALVPPIIPNTLTMYDSMGRLVETSIVATDVMKRAVPAKANDIAYFDSKGQVVDSGFTIFDNSTTNTNLWTSFKTDQEIGKRLIRPLTSTPGNTAIFDTSGEVVDSGINLKNLQANVDAMNVNAMPKHVPNAVGKVTTLTSDGRAVDTDVNVVDVQLRTVPSLDGNLAALNASGMLKDSSYVVSDTNVSTKSLYSNAKVTELLNKKLNNVPQYITGNLPMFDANGQLVDSSMSLMDVEKLAANACKIACPEPLLPLVPQKPNTIALIGADGQLKETSSYLTDFMEKQMGVSGKLGIFDASGQVIGSQYTVDDTAMPNANVLYSSLKESQLLSGKLNTVPTYTQGNLVTFTSSGQLQDSNETVSSILSKVDSKLTSVIPTIQPAVAGNLTKLNPDGTLTDAGVSLAQIQLANTSAVVNDVAIFDSNGFVADSGKQMNDSAAASSNIYWSSLKTQQDYTTKLNSKLNTVTPFTSGNVATFGSDGQLVSSTVNLSSLEQTLKALDSGAMPLVNPAVADNIPMLKTGGALADSGVSITSVMKKPTTATNLNIAFFDTQRQVQDTGVSLNDVSTANPNILWSSTKIQSVADSKLTKPASYTQGCVTTFDSQGQVICSGTQTSQLVTKVVPTQTNTLATLGADGSLQDSGKTLTNLMDKQPTALAGDLASFDANGQCVDSQYSVNDASLGTKVLWSSDKISTRLDQKLSKVSPFTAGNFPAFDSTGQLVDSALNPANITTQVDQNYLKKPTSFVAGDLVQYDGLGQVIDSGLVADNLNVKFNNPLSSTGNMLVINSNNKLYDSGIAQDKILLEKVPSRVNNIVTWNADGTQLDSGIRFDDSAPRSSQVAWTSAKTQMLQSGASENKLAIFDANGQVVDSGMTFSQLMSTISAINVSVGAFYVGGSLTSSAVATSKTEVALTATPTSGTQQYVSNSTFTCPEAGYYIINGTIEADCNNYTGVSALGIRLADNTTYREEQLATKTITTLPYLVQINFIQMLYLNKDDTIKWFWVYQGGLASTSPKNSTFYILKLV